MITPESFWVRVKKTQDCWIWTGRRTVRGYGQVRTDSGLTGAHRYSLEISGVAVPRGMLVCHHCDNPSCVRPDHLFIGTPLDNVRDMIAKGRERLDGRPKGCSDFCPAGHSLSGENAYVWGNGYRNCRECIRAAGRRYRARKKQAA